MLSLLLSVLKEVHERKRSAFMLWSTAQDELCGGTCAERAQGRWGVSVFVFFGSLVALSRASGGGDHEAVTRLALQGAAPGRPVRGYRATVAILAQGITRRVAFKLGSVCALLCCAMALKFMPRCQCPWRGVRAPSLHLWMLPALVVVRPSEEDGVLHPPSSGPAS